MRIEFVVPGEPIAQPRAKATAFAGKSRMYTPSKNGIREYKAAIRILAAQQYCGAPLNEPVIVRCEFVFSRPKRLVWKRREMPRQPHITKPDKDNCEKAVLDALKGVVLRDDSIVWGGGPWKFYAAGNEQPHTRIIIEWDETNQ